MIWWMTLSFISYFLGDREVYNASIINASIKALQLKGELYISRKAHSLRLLKITLLYKYVG